MEIQNNKEEVPFSHYLALFEKLDPQEAAARCGVPFENGCFTLTNLPCQTFLLRYLLEGKQAALSLGYKTFREMPWGELYITPYTGRCLTRAAFTFGTQVPAFTAACERMGGEKLSHGDAGYGFAFLGGYQMQIMIYAGDEEFPPSSQILYSDNFADGFSAEDRVVAGDILISAIRQEMKRK